MTAQQLDEVAAALRLVDRREAAQVVFRHEASSRRLRFSTDSAAFWGEVVAPRLSRRGGERLAALGWRPPEPHMPSWFQYFQPVRKRHHRWLAGLVAATFRDGLGLAESGIRAELADGPPACGPAFVLDEQPEPADDELLDIVEAVMAGFGPERYPTHLEFAMRRGRHRSRLAVSSRDGTVSCIVLHLPAPEPAVADAALAVSDLLDRVPYTYALRTVAGHGESLVLQTKFAVADRRPHPLALGMQLRSAIEPLLAAHRALREGAWGG